MVSTPAVIDFRRWLAALLVAIIVGVGSLYILVFRLRDTPLDGHYRGSWTNAQLIADRWPFHLVTVPRAKAAMPADALTMDEWYFSELRARLVAIPVLSVCAFLFTFFLIPVHRIPRQTI
jgi:hypothetical protein